MAMGDYLHDTGPGRRSRSRKALGAKKKVRDESARVRRLGDFEIRNMIARYGLLYAGPIDHLFYMPS